MTHSLLWLTPRLCSRKREKQTHNELLRNTPGSLGAKLLIASTALRAYRNRHLGTPMHCCEAWEPVGTCFDQCSFECIDFHGVSLIIASLTRKRIAVRETEIRILPWTQTEKENALAKCRLGLRAWRTKKPTLCLHAVTGEDGHLLESEDDSGMRLRTCRCKMFEARVEGEQHHCYETILEYIQQAPDDILWEICKNEFDELMAQKRILLSAPMEFRTAFAGVLEGEDLRCYSRCVNMYLLVARSLHSLLRGKLFSFPSLPTSTTMASS